MGDFEQTLPDFYSQLNYLQLYVLAAHDGTHTQIINEFDACCFAGKRAQLYSNAVERAATNSNGSYQLIMDDTHAEHKISSFTFEKIITSLTK
ncbi:MAG: hypothetical protein ACI8Y7_000376 [Candidatus Woesearchaeota archaeon]|jgi:hypothetical protein